MEGDELVAISKDELETLCWVADTARARLAFLADESKHNGVREVVKLAADGLQEMLDTGSTVWNHSERTKWLAERITKSTNYVNQLR